MKKLVFLAVVLCTIVAVSMTAGEAKAWCDHPSNPCHLPTPPPPPQPPAPPPAQPARVLVCLDGKTINIGVDELDDAQYANATEGACTETVSASPPEVTPPTTPTTPDKPDKPSKPKKPKRDICPNVPGFQGPNLWNEMQEHGWTKKNGKCHEPKKPPNDDLTG